ASVLVQLSGVHRLAQKGQPALEAAQEALDVALRAGSAQEVAMSLVAFAEAHVVLGNGKEAEELAKQAVPLFRQLGDEAFLFIFLDVVEQIASSARILQRTGHRLRPRRRWK
ncbi:unnamed protein product, partial [Prorocentrum cordatum]